MVGVRYIMETPMASIPTDGSSDKLGHPDDVTQKLNGIGKGANTARLTGIGSSINGIPNRMGCRRHSDNAGVL
jgi:hypothetical protein